MDVSGVRTDNGGGGPSRLCGGDGRGPMFNPASVDGIDNGGGKVVVERAAVVISAASGRGDKVVGLLRFLDRRLFCQ